MKSLEQNYRKGTLELVEIPHPQPEPGKVVVKTIASLASVGTEKAMIELARKSLIGKAKARPDLVKQVINKARTDGLLETWRQVLGRLETPIQLGYSSSGTVTAIGHGVSGFRVGDRVACTGSGYAGHSEMVSIPEKLCVPIPDGVDFMSASFVALGGIALESMRMANVELGSRVVVIGLGLLGQIIVQVLNAAGTHVFGVDLDDKKMELAESHGAEDVESASNKTSIVNKVTEWTDGHGADACIIVAATESNEPIELAATVCRERARIVATGMVGLDVPRKQFYDKELELVVSRAWGPGLYDSNYTDNGIDYPVPYARWTAERNTKEFLDQVGRGAVSTKDLITHKIPLDQAISAYQMIIDGSEPYLGVVLKYPSSSYDDEGNTKSTTINIESNRKSRLSIDESVARSHTSDKVTVGVIGSGLFANGTMLPAMKKVKEISTVGIASRTGLKVRHAAKKFGFSYCTTDTKDLIEDADIDLLAVLTRHDSHASLVSSALSSGKHVFVEKPLAVDQEQLKDVVQAYNNSRSEDQDAPRLMVGFNRRFSPSVKWLKAQIGSVSSRTTVNCLINAGPLPADSWIDDPIEGGGRIVGEICHFIDLIQHFTSALPVRVFAERMGNSVMDDSVVATLHMSNGDIASITYIAGGDKRYPRERVEIFGANSVGVIENFKTAYFISDGRKRSFGGRMSTNRGHQEELQILARCILSQNPSPVSMEEYVATTLATFALERSIRSRKSEPVAYIARIE